MRSAQINSERDIAFQLDAGVRLRFRGMSSACVSNKDDDRSADSTMCVLGCLQTVLPRQDSVEYVAMAHHPPDWLRDQDDAERYLNNRCRLQLFGHKHTPAIFRAGDGLRLVAGAVHPERKEKQWEPRYNIISFTVRAKPRKLIIDVRPRRWNPIVTAFVGDLNGDDSPIWRYEWKLPAAEADPSNDNRVPPVEDDTYLRRLRYWFRRLDWAIQLKIALELGLVAQGEFSSATATFAESVFSRCVGQARQADLYDRVAQSHGNQDLDPNPFRSPAEVIT